MVKLDQVQLSGLSMAQNIWTHDPFSQAALFRKKPSISRVSRDSHKEHTAVRLGCGSEKQWPVPDLKTSGLISSFYGEMPKNVNDDLLIYKRVQNLRHEEVRFNSHRGSARPGEIRSNSTELTFNPQSILTANGHEPGKQRIMLNSSKHSLCTRLDTLPANTSIIQRCIQVEFLILVWRFFDGNKDGSHVWLLEPNFKPRMLNGLNDCSKRAGYFENLELPKKTAPLDEIFNLTKSPSLNVTAAPVTLGEKDQHTLFDLHTMSSIPQFYPFRKIIQTTVLKASFTTEGISIGLLHSLTVISIYALCTQKKDTGSSKDRVFMQNEFVEHSNCATIFTCVEKDTRQECGVLGEKTKDGRSYLELKQKVAWPNHCNIQQKAENQGFKHQKCKKRGEMNVDLRSPADGAVSENSLPLDFTQQRERQQPEQQQQQQQQQQQEQQQQQQQQHRHPQQQQQQQQQQQHQQQEQQQQQQQHQQQEQQQQQLPVLVNRNSSNSANESVSGSDNYDDVPVETEDEDPTDEDDDEEEKYQQAVIKSAKVKSTIEHMDNFLIIWHAAFLIIFLFMLSVGIALRVYFTSIIEKTVKTSPNYVLYSHFVRLDNIPKEIEFGDLHIILGNTLIILSSCYVVCTAGYMTFLLHRITFVIPVVVIISAVVVLVEVNVINIYMSPMSALNEEAKKELREKAVKQYEVASDNAFSVTYDLLSIWGQCCGIVDQYDFQTAQLKYLLQTKLEEKERTLQVPPTCCQIQIFEKGVEEVVECASTAENIYATGCYTQLYQWLRGYCNLYSVLVFLQLIDICIHIMLYKKHVNLLTLNETYKLD